MRGNLRHRSRAWRTGVPGRRQPQCAGRACRPRPVRRGLLPPEPAQDLLHPARRRRPGRRARSACGAHLAPFLPGHGLVDMGGEHAGNGAVAAAPWGSASILPISWTYIAMMGPEGMKRATAGGHPQRQLHRQAPGRCIRCALHRAATDRVAHECIIDLRPFKPLCGITEEDVAKRLIDYGFHAPTMSLPGARNPDDRTHGKRIPGRNRPLLRRHAGHPRRNRRPWRTANGHWTTTRW